MHVDVGCARGRWVLSLADASSSLPSANHVGVEIRAPLVDEANAAAVREGRAGRVRYAAVDMARDTAARRALLSAVQPALRAVSVLFPDPYPPKLRRDERGKTLTASRTPTASLVAQWLRRPSL